MELPPSNVKMVMFDMDLTILGKHTGGCFYGTPEELDALIKPAFRQILPKLLDNGFEVGIVTFSDSKMKPETSTAIAGVALARKVLRLALGRRSDEASRVYVAAAYPNLHSGMPNSKAWHINQVCGDFPIDQIMFFDDSLTNVTAARETGVLAFHINPAEQFTHEIWRKACQSVSCQEA